MLVKGILTHPFLFLATIYHLPLTSSEDVSLKISRSEDGSIKNSGTEDVPIKISCFEEASTKNQSTEDLSLENVNCGVSSHSDVDVLVNAHEQAMFLQDYVLRYHITRVLVIGKREDPSRRRLSATLLLRLPAFVRVVTGENITAVANGNRSRPICTDRCAPFLVVMQAKVKEDVDTFMKFYEKESYRRVPWMVLIKPRLMDQLRRIYLALDNLIVFTTESDDGRSLTLYEAYKVGPSLGLQSSSVGSWSVRTGLQQQGPREPFGRRTDLTGLHLRVTTVPFAPFILTKENGDGTLSISGNHADLFNILQTSLNFTATFFSPPDGGWGALDPATGLMNGMLGQLQRGLADIAVDALDITTTRSQAVDFATPLDSFGYWLVMERPGQGSDWTSYTGGFSYGTWLLVLATAVVITVMLALVSRVSPSEVNPCSFSDAAVYVISACCNMGFEHQFHSLSVRLVVTVLFMMTMIIYTTYTTFMTATLAVVRTPMPFSDLQGLYSKRGEYHLGMLASTSLTDLLKSSEDPFFRNLWTDMLEPNPDDMVPTNEAGFARMMKLKYVFLTYAPTYEPSSDVTKLSEEYFKVPMSWPVPKRSPLLPILNFHFRRWLESGQYSRMWQRVQKRAALQPDGTRALGYEEVFTAFALLGAGLVLALVASGLEIALKNKKNVRPVDVEGDLKDRFERWEKLR